MYQKDCGKAGSADKMERYINSFVIILIIWIISLERIIYVRGYADYFYADKNSKACI